MSHWADNLADDVYEAVKSERVCAHAKHGEGTTEGTDPLAPHWLAILSEEVGEVARAICEHTLGNEDYETTLQDMHGELVQVAAMALAWADSIQSYGLVRVFDPVSARLQPDWIAEHNAKVASMPNHEPGDLLHEGDGDAS